jgi:hypothetical protein
MTRPDDALHRAWLARFRAQHGHDPWQQCELPRCQVMRRLLRTETVRVREGLL